MDTNTDIEEAKWSWFKNVVSYIKSSPDHEERSVKAIASTLNKDYPHFNQQLLGKRRVTDSVLQAIYLHYGIRFEGTADISQPEPRPATQTPSSDLPIYEVTTRHQGLTIIGVSCRIIAN